MENGNVMSSNMILLYWNIKRIEKTKEEEENPCITEEDNFAAFFYFSYVFRVNIIIIWDFFPSFYFTILIILFHIYMYFFQVL